MEEKYASTYALDKIEKSRGDLLSDNERKEIKENVR